MQAPVAVVVCRKAVHQMLQCFLVRACVRSCAVDCCWPAQKVIHGCSPVCVLCYDAGIAGKEKLSTSTVEYQPLSMVRILRVPPEAARGSGRHVVHIQLSSSVAVPLSLGGRLFPLTDVWRRMYWAGPAHVGWRVAAAVCLLLCQLFWVSSGALANMPGKPKC